MTLLCNHTFHINCLTPWLEKKISCPNCRDKIQNKIFSTTHAISDDDSESDEILTNDV